MDFLCLAQYTKAVLVVVVVEVLGSDGQIQWPTSSGAASFDIVFSLNILDSGKHLICLSRNGFNLSPRLSGRMGGM